MEKIINYTSYINEALDFENLKEKLSDNYNDIKKDILDQIQATIEGTESKINMTTVEDFISDYIATGKESSMIDKLISDSDLFNFYLRHQSEIDELLNKIGYLDKTPKENEVYGLYDFVIDGTKTSILSILKLTKKDLFKK
jgi:hypothetical protein